MSEIFGTVVLGGAPVEPRQLRRMAAALAAEDPSAASLFIGGAVGLGVGEEQRRRVGESGGESPVTVDDQFALVCDGHIDNRSQLAVALGLPSGYAGLPTAPILLAALRQWGLDCLNRLVGEFTFAAWDVGRRRLVVGSSAPLARPLYLYTDDRRFAFASRARGLFTLPGVSPRIDEQRVAGFLTFAETGPSRSFFVGIERLLPGQVLVVDAGGPQLRQWWRPDLTERMKPRSDDEYREAFDELFSRVVADHLAGPSVTGLSLSGGLDSSAIAAEAASQLARDGRRLVAYTEIPPEHFDGFVPAGRYGDETDRVEALARLYPNIDLVLERGGQRGLLDSCDAIFSAAEAPIRASPNRGWIEAIYTQASDTGVGTLLTGDHGNLIVSWEGRGVLAELLRAGRPFQAVREARAGAATGRSRSAAGALLGLGLWPLIEPLLGGAVGRFQDLTAPDPDDRYPHRSLIAPEFAAQAGLAPRDLRRREAGHARARRVTRAGRLRRLVVMGSRSAELVAGYRRHFGVDTRAPLADRRLIEFCLALPETQFERAGVDRYLVRRAMAEKLPSQTLGSTSRGLQAAAWFEQMTAERGRLLEAVSQFESDELTRRVLDLPRVRGLLEGWPHRAPRDAGGIGLYRAALGNAMMIGAFLNWAQRSDSWPAQTG